MGIVKKIFDIIIPGWKVNTLKSLPELSTLNLFKYYIKTGDIEMCDRIILNNPNLIRIHYKEIFKGNHINLFCKTDVDRNIRIIEYIMMCDNYIWSYRYNYMHNSKTYKQIGDVVLPTVFHRVIFRSGSPLYESHILYGVLKYNEKKLSRDVFNIFKDLLSMDIKYVINALMRENNEDIYTKKDKTLMINYFNSIARKIKIYEDVIKSL